MMVRRSPRIRELIGLSRSNHNGLHFGIRYVFRSERMHMRFGTTIQRTSVPISGPLISPPTTTGVKAPADSPSR